MTRVEPSGAHERDPLVSVVLPTYRRSDLVERALQTVTSQTFDDWELLIVDDNGRDTEAQRSTEAVVKGLDSDARVVYHVHDSNRGACAARNTGIHQARGRYVAFLDDDDAWYPTKLERQVECFRVADPSVALVYGGFRRVDESGRTTTVHADGSAHRWSNLLMRNGIGTTSLVMCRKDALLDVGGFDERLPSMQDYDLYLRLAQKFDFSWVEEPLLDKHRHAGVTIGKDFDGIYHANALFYEKHSHLYDGNRVLHNHRLRWFAFQAMRADRISIARRLLWRAWLQRPYDLGSLVLALGVNRPLLQAYRTLRQRVRRVSTGRQRSRQIDADAVKGR